MLTLGELDRFRAARDVAVEVDDLDTLVTDLLDTMRASPGCVGLAAPQIGVSSRVFVVDVSAHPKTRTCHGEIVLYNARLLSSDDPATEREGCMSVPDLTGDVSRARHVVVEGFDPSGTPRRIETDHFEARALQHELDHLDGLVFLDRVVGPNAIHKRRVYR